MSASSRFSFNESFIYFFWPIAYKKARHYSNDGGVPDSETRQEILDAIIDITRLLIDSYKIFFKDTYQASNFTYARSSKKFLVCGLRILELSRFLQRVKGLRYQVLTNAEWLAINTVFHVMRLENLTDGKVTLLNRPVDSKNQKQGDSKKQSLKELFLSIQMIAQFDILKWPTEWQSFFDSYGMHIEALADLIEDNDKPISRNQSVTYCYENGAVRNMRPENASGLGPSCIINWEKLTRKVTMDFANFFMNKGLEDKTGVPQKLSMLSAAEATALAFLQFDGYRQTTTQIADEDTSGKVCDLRIFIGFNSVYQLLDNIHYGHRTEGVGNRLVDMLAKHSATIGEDHVSTVESIWHLQFEDSKIVRLKTQETKYNTPMKIGSLAAYGFGSEGIKQPFIGMIFRIYRPTTKTVVIDIAKLCSVSEPVLVTPDMSCLQKFDKRNAKIIDAILTIDETGMRKLLLPTQSKLRENDPLVMQQSTNPQLIELGKLQTVTKDYFYFQLKEES
jgi:hypothetical protein